MTKSVTLSQQLDGAADVAQTGKERIVFWAARGAVFQGLAQAIQLFLPDFDVLLVDRLPEEDDDHSKVRLLLLDLGRSPEFGEHVTACRQRFPNAALGLVIEAADASLADCDALFDRYEVQGLLPLDLELEIWLAAMSLLISGGEYYPPMLSRRARSQASGLVDSKIVASDTLTSQFGSAGANPAIACLTSRERQVLELLSEGYQNKLIANRMTLSEHTVKVHVHNLITKLHVSNRTQAAAAFRFDFGRSGPGSASLQFRSGEHGQN